ncbi:hypothetical protein NDI45_24305 [Leptolyngbya sp. GB1-A1]|uniref:hypothetical protein n=1 Tax=Leptolyngbya sp. GB1-A1 TaxID=2933908 RepID=UPI0032978019
MNLSELKARLAELEQEAAELRGSGDCLQGVRLEFAPGGGTASVSAKQSLKYARLRAGRGKLLPSGKRSQYVPLADISRIEAAIERGKRLTAIEKEIGRVQVKIERVEVKVAALEGR